jgi:hypothetical protein
MSDFLDYYKKTEQAKAMTEEEQLALHKKHKLIAAQRHKLDEEDDFYKDDDDDDISINEGRRIYKKPVRMPQPAPRPAPQPVPRPAPAPRPVPRPLPEDPDDFGAPAPAPRPKAPVRDPFDDVPTAPSFPAPRKRRIQTMEESSNPALKEAFSMMEEMQKKIETMFYRYGMAGLEKINECMEDVFEDIVNPRPVPEIKYIEKPAAPARPKKKIVRKPSTVTETTTTKKTTTTTPMSPEKLQQAFENINNNLDIAQVAAVATKTENTQTESIGESTMKKVQANAMMLEKSMNKKNEKPTEEVDENYVQPEEFDIVDDNVIDDPVAEAKNYDDVVPTNLDEHTANTTDLNDIPSNEEE